MKDLLVRANQAWDKIGDHGSGVQLCLLILFIILVIGVVGSRFGDYWSWGIMLVVAMIRFWWIYGPRD